MLVNFMPSNLAFSLTPKHQQLNTEAKQEQHRIKLSKQPWVHTEDTKPYEDGSQPINLSCFIQVQIFLCSDQQQILNKE